jgi:phage baseplate assembly protein V
MCGEVAESKPGFARVRFLELGEFMTQWLPVLHPKTMQDKLVWTLDVGELVACLMDSNLEDGWIAGAMYSDADAPPVESADKLRLAFKDGGSFEYDRATGAMAVVTTGDLSAVVGGTAVVEAAGALTLKSAAAVTIKGSAITLDAPMVSATGAVDAATDVTVGAVSLKMHKHGGVAGGGSKTGVPTA